MRRIKLRNYTWLSMQYPLTYFKWVMWAIAWLKGTPPKCSIRLNLWWFNWEPQPSYSDFTKEVRKWSMVRGRPRKVPLSGIQRRCSDRGSSSWSHSIDCRSATTKGSASGSTGTSMMPSSCCCWGRLWMMTSELSDFSQLRWALNFDWIRSKTFLLWALSTLRDEVIRGRSISM